MLAASEWLLLAATFAVMPALWSRWRWGLHNRSWNHGHRSCAAAPQAEGKCQLVEPFRRDTLLALLPSKLSGNQVALVLDAVLALDPQNVDL